MNGWFDVWHNLSPGQGTLLGGAFVLLAGIIAFGTGAFERRSKHKRYHYEEMKTLYAEALRIGRDLALLKALPPDDRGPILTEKVDAMQTVISELASIPSATGTNVTLRSVSARLKGIGKMT